MNDSPAIYYPSSLTLSRIYIMAQILNWTKANNKHATEIDWYFVDIGKCTIKTKRTQRVNKWWIFIDIACAIKLSKLCSMVMLCGTFWLTSEFKQIFMISCWCERNLVVCYFATKLFQSYLDGIGCCFFDFALKHDPHK